METITKEWLKEQRACSEGYEWFINQKTLTSIEVVKKLMAQKKLEWANWLIVRVMNYKQRVQYAVFAAEQVIGIYEKKYPEDKRPKEAIEAAKKCIDNPSKENKKAAYAAYAAANAAAHAAANAAAYAANAAAYAAAYAAYAAANAAAYAAANAAYAAYAAAYAANAANAANAAKEKLKIKILKYGISLLKEAHNGR